MKKALSQHPARCHRVAVLKRGCEPCSEELQALHNHWQLHLQRATQVLSLLPTQISINRQQQTCKQISNLTQQHRMGLRQKLRLRKRQQMVAEQALGASVRVTIAILRQ